MYEGRLKHLKESHRVLDEKITAHEREHPHSESQLVQEWKKQKLVLKDEIRRLERLQWEHDHDSVDFEDDGR
jgi:hypothetical protein